MAKPEWGTKRHCKSCGAKFYDLEKDPILCPECGATYVIETLEKPKPSRAQKAAPVEEKKKPDPAEDEEDEALDEEDEADTFLEDDEEDTDVSDVIEPAIEEKDET